MKRSIILLLVLFPIFAFSQMQQIMNQNNSFATKRSNNNYSVIGITSDLIKIRSIDQNKLVVSLPYVSLNNTDFIFLVGGTNNVMFSTINGVKVYDFQIYNDTIYFCGKHNSQGCLGWTPVSNLISLNPQLITLKIINNPISTSIITELEVYKATHGVSLVAIADNKYLIELNTAEQNYYQIIENNTGQFKNIALGSSKIVAIEHVNDTSFIVAAFDKGYLPNYLYSSFSHPELRFSSYVLENSLTDRDTFTLAYTHRKRTINNYYKTDFVTFEVATGINIINNQCLEVYNAKLEPIDLEFCKEDSALLYLTNGHNGNDEIFQIDPFDTNVYISNSIQPTPHINVGIKQYNSIIRYDDYFFATVTKNGASDLIIFDCKRDMNQANCANYFQEKVQMYNFLTPTIINTSYTFYIGTQSTLTTTAISTLSSNQISCQ
ncbi:MAG: hypothetical protein U0L22_05890 [Bacteroidales bacterium]|nr:hypothetical protein [Bacteroidales bacterium]